MRNTARKLMVVATALFAAQLSIGCGDSDSETARPGGAGGSGAGGPGAGGSGGGEGTPLDGAPAMACLMSSENHCQEYRGNLVEGWSEATKTECVDGGGTVVDACSNDGLIGTCRYASGESEVVTFFYEDHEGGADLKAACEGATGVWEDG